MKIINEINYLIPRISLTGLALTDTAREDYLFYVLDLGQVEREDTVMLSVDVRISLRRGEKVIAISFGEPLPLAAVPPEAVTLRLLLEESFDRDHILTTCVARASALTLESRAEGVHFTLGVSEGSVSTMVPYSEVADFFVPLVSEPCVP